MERTLGMEIVQAIAEAEDKDSVLQRYLDAELAVVLSRPGFGGYV
jgi:hypothetical protein